MKTQKLATMLIALAILPMAQAQRGTLQFEEKPPSNPPPPPPRIYQVQPPPTTAPATPAQTGPVYVYEQKPFGGRPVLVTQEQAQTIIDGFKDAYSKLGSPRFLIYVNRELVDEQSGMKLIKRNERIESTRNSDGENAGSTIKATGKNTYRSDGKSQPTLADKQTVRDVERLFGRPLRTAGANLADQRVAAQLIADRPLNEFIGTTDAPQARKDREALGKITDAVIEILISSKNVTVQNISGSQSVSIPDIQATAIRLSDSRILGQASSSDVTTRVPPATLGSFDVSEIAEATALALMEDMTPVTK
jgi:hypothetical protein